MSERKIERVYYVYVLYWYDMCPSAYLDFDKDDNPIPRVVRPSGEADPIVMTDREKLKTLVKARTGKDKWVEVNINLWRLDNYWIKQCILGYDIDLDKIDFTENWVEKKDDGGWIRYRKLSHEK